MFCNCFEVDSMFVIVFYVRIFVDDLVVRYSVIFLFFLSFWDTFGPGVLAIWGLRFVVGFAFDCFCHLRFAFLLSVYCFGQFLNLWKNIIELIRVVRTLLDNKVIGYCDVEHFLFLVESVNLYVTLVGVSIIWFGPFWSGCNFLKIPFCVVKLGFKTNVDQFSNLRLALSVN